MQKEKYIEAEEAYRRALVIGPDNNKMCNLGICLMKQGRIAEAKETLKQVRPATINEFRGADSHLKAYERAQEMLRDLESKLVGNNLLGQDRMFDQTRLFNAFLGSSSLWQPQPCTDYPTQQVPEKGRFASENLVISGSNSLNIDAPPFYSSRLLKDANVAVPQFHDPMGNLKRTRSGNVAEKSSTLVKTEEFNKRRSLSFEDAVGGNKWPELPDNNAFDEAILAAVLAPVLEDDEGLVEGEKGRSPALVVDGGKMGKRLRVFEDITLAMNNSPKAKVLAGI